MNRCIVAKLSNAADESVLDQDFLAGNRLLPAGCCMPVANSPRQHRSASLSGKTKSSQTQGSQKPTVERDSLILATAKRSYGLEQVPQAAPHTSVLLKCCLRLANRDSCILQIVQAVEGAVVGLRDQLEALTILDETALTWPGLSLVWGPCSVHLQLLQNIHTQ